MGGRSMNIFKELLYSLKSEYRTVVLIVLLLATLLSPFFLASCSKVQYIPKETVRIDSIYVNQVKRDSIYVQDSVYVREKGDTLLIVKTKYKYIDRCTHDTIYKEKIDSVAVPYPVEKQLSWLEKKYMQVGRLALALLALAIVGGGIWLILKARRVL